MSRYLPLRLPSLLEALLMVFWAILATLSPASGAQTALDNPYPNPYEAQSPSLGDPQADLWKNAPHLNPRQPWGTPAREPYGATVGHSHGPHQGTYIQWHPDMGAPAQAPYVQTPAGSFYDEEPGYW